MRRDDQTISSIEELLEKLKQDTTGCPAPRWYRGHSRKDYPLIPSFFRDNVDSHFTELDLINRFKQNGDVLIEPRITKPFEWLFIMRHYDVPTRLLDWTESPLTALYFAVSDAEKKEEDGVLWVLLPTELNKNTNVVTMNEEEIPGVEDINNYGPDSYEGETSSALLPVAFICPRTNERMIAQTSVFTIHHKDKTAIESIGEKDHVWRYVIPKDCKTAIKNELELLGLTRFQLYPELQSIGRMIKEKIMEQVQ
ncbi:MAG: FRG domain-containing protein [Candidatus ainarchaeum sp.]|nr:FRG domain-containing protein [Candidatus ainarchaeum sp.]